MDFSILKKSKVLNDIKLAERKISDFMERTSNSRQPPFVKFRIKAYGLSSDCDAIQLIKMNEYESMDNVVSELFDLSLKMYSIWGIGFNQYRETMEISLVGLPPDSGAKDLQPTNIDDDIINKMANLTRFACVK